jgi:hypothetical protein
MADETPADTPVRHKLQVHFDTHECAPSREELEQMAGDLDMIARQAGNFPVADARVLIEWNGRNKEYAVKLTLILTGEPLVTSDHDAVLHAAFERAVHSLSHALQGYKARLDGVAERRRLENGTRHEVVPAVLPDATALHSAAEAGDYAAFRAAIAPYEEPLGVRIGRWVERYPAVEAKIGRDFAVSDILEGVFLAAFEAHARRPDGMRYGEWLEELIDPTVRAIEHNPAKELENIRMVRSAAEAGS